MPYFKSLCVYFLLFYEDRAYDMRTVPLHVRVKCKKYE